MTAFESLVFLVLGKGRLKLNWTAVLISKFRISVTGLWRPRDVCFFPCLIVDLASGLLCIALFFGTLGTEHSRPTGGLVLLLYSFILWCMCPI